MPASLAREGGTSRHMVKQDKSSSSSKDRHRLRESRTKEEKERKEDEEDFLSSLSSSEKYLVFSAPRRQVANRR